MLGSYDENASNISPTEGAAGPYVDDLEGFKQAWDAQTEASAAQGVTQGMSERDAAQVQMLRQNGVDKPPVLSPDLANYYINSGGRTTPLTTGNYMNVARFYTQGGDKEMADQLSAYDAQIDELKKKHPTLQLKNSRDILEETLKAGADAERTLSETKGGSIGKFVGGAVGSMNPMTDPWNAASLGIGGVGKTFAVRLAAQMGMQGAVEAVNEFTGVQEQRGMMGLDHGFGDAMSRIAMVAGGAGVLHAGGEGVAAGFKGARRWWKGTPEDPAPVASGFAPDKQAAMQANVDQLNKDLTQSQNARLYPDNGTFEAQAQIAQAVKDLSPLTATPEGRARAAGDLDYIKSRLEGWDEKPLEIKPPGTDTANISALTRPDVSVSEGMNVDQLARRVDPETFRVYDGMATEQHILRSKIDEINQSAGKKAAADVQAQTVADLEEKIANMTHNMYQVGKKRRAEMQVKLDALKQERDAAHFTAGGTDTPEQAAMRKRLLQVNDNMREMSPRVQRAYAQAQGKWSVDEEGRRSIQQMVRDGGRELPPSNLTDAQKRALDALKPQEVFPRTLTEKAPILEQAPKVEAQMRPDADALHYAAAIVKENVKMLDEARDAFRTSIKTMLKDAEKGDGFVVIPGTDKRVKMSDKVTAALEDGSGEKTMSVKELLQQQLDKEEDISAVTSCSI